MTGTAKTMNEAALINTSKSATTKQPQSIKAQHAQINSGNLLMVPSLKQGYAKVASSSSAKNGIRTATI